ncbi:MAG: DNA polymerase III subunit gamma/tau [Myxococcales bacterium]|nr:DNA polymerase III subunit gamma/tau [Myxococcales bacterium]
MSYLVLARKWRPSTFDEVIGQEGAVRTLKNAIAQDRVAHAYLFCGARGVGKTTVARILAKALNCQQGPTAQPDNSCAVCQEIARGASPDVFEIDGASNTGVDDVRALRENAAYLPARSRFKIYIIDEVHMLSTSAFNALLKILEEPPAHVKFIFATTEPHKIPLTVLSRCQRFDFRRIPAPVIQQHLLRLCQAEKAAVDEEALRLIAREAQGSMRDSLSLLDQVLAFGGEKIGVAQVQDALGLAPDAVLDEVCAALSAGDAGALVRRVGRLFEEGADLKRFLEGLLERVHRLILFATIPNPEEMLDLLPEEVERLRAQAKLADPLRWHQIFEGLSRTVFDLGRHPFPRLLLECALLRLAALDRLSGLDELTARLEEVSRRLAGGGAGPASSSSTSGKGPRFERRPSPAAPPAPGPAPRQEASPPPKEVSTPVGPPSGAAALAPECSQAGGATLSEEWQKLVGLVCRKRPALGSVLQHACPIAVSAQKVRLALEPGSFYADQLKSARNRDELARCCEEFFGSRPQIEVETLAQAPGLSLAQAQDLEAKRNREELRRRAVEHPVVQEAIRVFGAEVDAVEPGAKDSGGGRSEG